MYFLELGGLFKIRCTVDIWLDAGANCFGSSGSPFIYAWFNLLQWQQLLANLTAKLGI